MSESNKGSTFPDLDVARRLYDLPENATEQDIINEVIRRVQGLGLQGNTIEKLTESANTKAAQLEKGNS